MRISDWSSDVCSSDLDLVQDDPARARRLPAGQGAQPPAAGGRVPEGLRPDGIGEVGQGRAELGELTRLADALPASAASANAPPWMATADSSLRRAATTSLAAPYRTPALKSLRQQDRQDVGEGTQVAEDGDCGGCRDHKKTK